MRFSSETISDGVAERLFTLGDVTGVLWSPADTARASAARASAARADADRADADRADADRAGADRAGAARAGAAHAERPLVLLGHGGGQHKKAPGMVARARRYVTGSGFAAAAIDAPGHGDRPRTEQDERFTADIRARMARSEERRGGTGWRSSGASTV